MPDWQSWFDMVSIASYLPIIGVITMLMLLIMLITYLVSRTLKVPEWDAYLNIELSELFKSILIMLVAVGFYTTLNSLVESILGVPDVGAAAIRFLDQMTTQGVLPGLRDSFTLQSCLSIWNMFTRRIGEYVLTGTYKLFPGIDSVLGVLSSVGFGMSAIYGSLRYQILMLTFARVLAVNFALPAGIILRFFPPTREAGCFVIALALGFGIIFPATYVIHAQVMTQLGISVYSSPNTAILSMCGGHLLIAGSVFGIAGLAGTIGNAAASAIGIALSEVGINMITPLEFTYALDSLAALSLPGLFMPALSTVITMSFIGALTKFLVSKA